jgi:hypothetical protein
LGTASAKPLLPFKIMRRVELVAIRFLNAQITEASELP